MGLFGSIMKAGGSLLASAESALAKITTADTLNRVCQAAFLIANADDNFEDSEKQMLQKVVARKLPHFKNAEIANAIDAAVDECAFSKVAGKLNLMENIAQARGTDDAKLIMLAVLAVANADGDFSKVEMDIAREICSKLGLRTSEYGL